MNEQFKPMFKKNPDEILSGDYYYRIPWIEAEQKKYGLWLSSEEKLRSYEEYSRVNFMKSWNLRTLSGKFDKSRDDLWLREVKENPKESEIYRIFSEIAASGTPVVDLCSSDFMGMLPYLLKLNPSLPCIAQDVDTDTLHRLHRRLDENFPHMNVSLASFDNLDMPIYDNSVPCVTGSGFITNCSMNRNFEHKPGSTLEEANEDFRNFTENLQRQAIDEVFRILKPGGLMILDDGCEDELEYDVRQVNGFFDNGGRLFGLYSRDEVTAKLKEYENERKRTVTLEEKLLSAGFEKVFIGNYRWDVPPQETARMFRLTGDPVELEENAPGKDLIKHYVKTALFILRKPTEVK